MDDEVAIRAVAAVMEDLRPDVILTFGPDGITGHADHRLVSRWATEAWRRTGRRSELLYATMTDRHLVQHAGLHEQIGLFSEFGGDEGLGVAEDDLALTASLAEPELDRKRLALAAHGSQTAELAALMGEATYRRWWSTEWFRRPTAAEVAACPLVGPSAAVAGVAA